jgi:drug/metabolite transporter (DMT)-like permease
MIATLEPVLTIVWAVLLLGEELQPVQVVGGLLVLTGVIWAQRSAGQVVVAVARRRSTRKREKTSSWSM